MKVDLTKDEWSYILSCLDYVADDMLYHQRIQDCLYTTKFELDLINKLQYANKVEELVKS